MEIGVNADSAKKFKEDVLKLFENAVIVGGHGAIVNDANLTITMSWLDGTYRVHIITYGEVSIDGIGQHEDLRVAIYKARGNLYKRFNNARRTVDKNTSFLDDHQFLCHVYDRFGNYVKNINDCSAELDLHGEKITISKYGEFGYSMVRKGSTFTGDIDFIKNMFDDVAVIYEGKK